MDVRSEVADGVTIHHVAGRIDAATSASLDAAIKAGLAGNGQRVLLDLSEVAYISSAGLRIILMAAKAVKTAGGGFAIFGLQPAVAEVFKVSGFTNLVAVGTDLADARSKL